MPVEITVDLHGPGAAAALVERFRARVSDFRPVLRGRFAESVRELFQQQWITEGTHGGTPWPPPSFTTLLLRRRRGSAAFKALLDTGQMRDEWAGTGGVEVGPTWFRKTGRIGWPAAHQKGFTTSLRSMIPGKVVPARPIIPPEMPKNVVAIWEHVLLEYVLRGRT